VKFDALEHAAVNQRWKQVIDRFKPAAWTRPRPAQS
jgi:hypothetical protein